MNNFLISGYGRSGTKFLSNLMNKSSDWEVLHEPTGYWDYETSLEWKATLPPDIQSRFQKDNYGEVNSMLCNWFLDVDVKKRGLIFRNPTDIMLSVANRKSPENFIEYSKDILETYERFETYIKAYDLLGDEYNIHIINFEKMVSDIKYCQSILEHYGITDINVTGDILEKKVNQTHQKIYTDMSQFDDKIKLNITKTNEIYRKYK
tara:strand:+ start:49 stop:666 length:618 start_codon:yes stop_codon:yes gene_type:complete